MKTLGMEDTGPSEDASDVMDSALQTNAAAGATATAMTTDADDELDPQALENYRIWKKNTPFLYDVVIVCAFFCVHMHMRQLSPLTKHDDRHKDCRARA